MPKRLLNALCCVPWGCETGSYWCSNEKQYWGDVTVQPGEVMLSFFLHPEDPYHDLGTYLSIQSCKQQSLYGQGMGIHHLHAGLVYCITLVRCPLLGVTISLRFQSSESVWLTGISFDDSTI